jgi:hypothetical protein
MVFGKLIWRFQVFLKDVYDSFSPHHKSSLLIQCMSMEIHFGMDLNGSMRFDGAMRCRWCLI